MFNNYNIYNNNDMISSIDDYYLHNIYNYTNMISSPINDDLISPTNSDYYNSLPEGIYKWQIPPGEEDKYILKSQVVPPVCPKCPDVQCNNTSSNASSCPPCPACTRCPEPAYDCKLVPNYSSMNANAPVPVLNDFSTFGM